MSAKRLGNKYCVGHTLSENTKSKISESLKQYFATHPNSFIGRKHKPETIEKLKNRMFSEETKRKMSESHADVSGANNPSAKGVAQYSLDGTFIKEYPYATLAAKELGLDLSSIIKCCRHKLNQTGGYKWEYVK